MAQTGDAPKMILMVGLPYSGKSFYLPSIMEYAHSANELPTTRVGFDLEMMRLSDETKLSYNELFEQGYSKAAQERAAESFDKHLALGWNVIVDQTNLTKASRRNKLLRVPEGYEKIAVIIPEPSREEFLRRYAARTSHSVPTKVLLEMRNMYEVPELDEGFDLLIEKGFEDLIYAKDNSR